jgi:transposase
MSIRGDGWRAVFRTLWLRRSLRPWMQPFSGSEDEASVKTNMTRLGGRSPCGHRLVAAVPHGHWKTSTFVAGLRCDGLTSPLVIGGAMNGEVFLAYIEQILAPTLSSDRRDHGQLAEAQDRRRARGDRGTRHGLALSPGLQSRSDPIERAFAKFKSLLRTAAARSIDALWKAIGNALQCFGPTEYANYFANSGYRATDIRRTTGSLGPTSAGRCGAREGARAAFLPTLSRAAASRGLWSR